MGVSLGLAVVCSLVNIAVAENVPTFSRDIAPILQKNCVGCHRAGEAAPMSLQTYKQARPFAAAIREAVTLRKMPPWYADSHYGTFANDRSLSQGDIDTLVAWAKNGAPEGNPKDLPAPPEFVEGWGIGKPDMVLEMPASFDVPATGVVDYQYVLVPGKFTEDTWVQMSEVRPGDRSVLHHVIAFVRPRGSKWLEGIQPGIPFVPKDGERGNGQFLVGYAPGMPAEILPEGRAKLIRAGSDIVFQMHYTPNGKATTDRSKIGLVFAKGPVKERIFTLAVTTEDFAIPPGESNYKVQSDFEFGADAKVVEMMPHMHLRGKDFEFEAIYPTGERQILLRVPHYSFSWQLTYYPKSDIVMPKGTILRCTAHYDNSANNPYNPDPTKLVKYGDQSWDEMMFGFFDVAIAKDMNVRELSAPDKKKGHPAPAPLPVQKTGAL